MALWRRRKSCLIAMAKVFIHAPYPYAQIRRLLAGHSTINRMSSMFSQRFLVVVFNYLLTEPSTLAQNRRRAYSSVILLHTTYNNLYTIFHEKSGAKRASINKLVSVLWADLDEMCSSRKNKSSRAAQLFRCIHRSESWSTILSDERARVDFLLQFRHVITNEKEILLSGCNLSELWREWHD